MALRGKIKVSVRVCSIGVNGIASMIKVTVRVCSIGANGIQREIKAAMESRGKSRFLYEYAP